MDVSGGIAPRILKPGELPGLYSGKQPPVPIE
jgi:hypothetical protein